MVIGAEHWNCPGCNERFNSGDHPPGSTALILQRTGQRSDHRSIFTAETPHCLRDAVHDGLSRCLNSQFPLAEQRAYLTELRRNGWSQGSLRHVELELLRMLAATLGTGESIALGPAEPLATESFASPGYAG